MFRPRRPAARPAAVATESRRKRPQSLDNRPGLSAFAYRIGDHAQFRASVHASLSSSQFAPLARLRTRDDDDFTIGLIDAFACTADVLTFYQERIANESYLRTAVERVSLQELGKLVGYRLRPGVAAETWLAFALDTPPTPPADAAAGAGQFRHRRASNAWLSTPGCKVQSVPGPGEKPQTFETVEPLAEARAAWNAMRPWLERSCAIPSVATRRSGSTALRSISRPATRCCSSEPSSSRTRPATTGTSGSSPRSKRTTPPTARA